MTNNGRSSNDLGETAVLEKGGQIFFWQSVLLHGRSYNGASLLNRRYGNASFYAMNTTEDLISGGFMTFGLGSIWDLNLLLLGLRGDILDASGHPFTARSWFIGGGILLQLPLIGFTCFVWRQGFFGH